MNILESNLLNAKNIKTGVAVRSQKNSEMSICNSTRKFKILKDGEDRFGFILKPSETKMDETIEFTSTKRFEYYVTNKV